MTQTPIAPATPDDIVLEDESLTHRLDLEADALIAEGEARGGRPQSLRAAVRADAAQVRNGLEDGVAVVQSRIREEPVRAAFYAFGLGLIAGLLLKR
jgi:hypothetical protein